jgi:hypothetical protein
MSREKQSHAIIAHKANKSTHLTIAIAVDTPLLGHSASCLSACTGESEQGLESSAYGAVWGPVRNMSVSVIGESIRPKRSACYLETA